MKKLLLVVLAAAMLVPATQSGNDLFQQALVKERTEGNLAEAVKLYQRIVAEFAGDRKLSARALMQMGLCYEKLGAAEAQKAYRRLISEYPEQAQQVDAARQRLAALAAQAGAQRPRFQRIQVPTVLSRAGSGKLSPDGQKLAFISGGSLWVLPVHGKSDPNVAGEPVRLTPAMSADDNANISIEWSGNGRWIAFRVAVPKPNRNAESEIYLIPAEGGAPKRLPISWKDWADDVYTMRYALSANAETLYFAAGATHETLRIYSMPVAGGEWKPLTEPTTRQPALSPDGTRIAYVRMIKDATYNRFVTKEIWVAPASGGKGTRVYTPTDEGWVQGPVWSPDGSMVAFLASKLGNNHRQVCMLSVRRDGSPGTVTKFDLPSETGDIMAGWTKDKLGILIPAERQTSIYTVPATGGKATQLTTEYAAIPNWTPDGKAIYFDGAYGAYHAAIEFMPAGGGKVTRVPIDKEFEFLQPSYPLAGISLSPDGKTICYAGFYRRGGPGSAIYLSSIYLLPREGGRPERLTTNAMGDYQPAWSPDGRRVAFIRREKAPGDQVIANIFVVSPEGGEPRRITTAEDKVQLAAMDWSPDGELIAFYGRDNEENPSPCLRVIPAKGGQSQILVPKISSPGLYWAGLVWSPDGRSLAYVSQGVLWTISRNGGTPARVETGLNDSRMAKIDWSPDGRTIAFEATKGGEHELWLMEDFLPLVNGGR